MPSDADPATPADRARLGVLLVHGIGQQEQGDTLVRFGEPILRWLEGWYGDGRGPDTPVRQSDRHLRPGPDEPARTRLHVDRGPSIAPVDWLLAECSWQSTIRAPGRGQTAAWTAGFGPRLIMRIARREQAAVSRATRHAAAGTGDAFVDAYVRSSPAAYLPAIANVVGTAVLLTVALVATVALWALLAVTFLPLSLIPGTRGLLQKMQRALSAVIGDTYLLTQSPFSRGAMVERVQRDLDWLEARADRIAVVAHSQGSVIAHAALSERHRASELLFVSFGSPLRALTSDALGTELDDPSVDGHLTLGANGASAEWLDVHATADPVSAGPLWMSERPWRASSLRVRNRGSWIADHTRYWQNRDGFVGPLVQRLGAFEGEPIARDGRDEKVLARAVGARAQRVGLLVVTRYLLLVCTLATALGGAAVTEPLGNAASSVVASVTSLFGDGVEITADRRAWAGAGVALLLGALAYAAAAFAWSRWDTAAVDAMHRREPPRTPPAPRLAVAFLGALGPVALAVLVLGEFGLSFWPLVVAAGTFVAVLVMLRLALVADYGPGPPRPAPVDLRTLEQGDELANRDGWVIRHVRVAEPPEGRVPPLKLANFNQPEPPVWTVVIEMLDDPPRFGWRSVHNAKRGERVTVTEPVTDPPDLQASWDDHVRWLALHAEWRS